jgi:hypothetical protein
MTGCVVGQVIVAAFFLQPIHCWPTGSQNLALDPRPGWAMIRPGRFRETKTETFAATASTSFPQL